MGFGGAGTSALDMGRAPAKPFDGFKTQTNPIKKPFDFRGGKSGPSTDYAGGMSVGQMEKTLANDIAVLDWELKTQPKPFQSEAKFKPNLFVKKNPLNATGETRATEGASANEWDLSSGDGGIPTRNKPMGGLGVGKGVAAKKELSTVVGSDWDLGEPSHIIAPKGGAGAVKKPQAPVKKYYPA